MAPIVDLEKQVDEALSAVAKAQTSGVFESTGAWSYDLTGIVSLIPVVTPLRDKIGREASQNGSPFAIWRAFLDVTSSQPRPNPGFDRAASEVVTSVTNFQAPYVPVGLAGLVTQDAFDLAKGLYDPYATETMQVLQQVLIGEDRQLAGGQAFATPQPGNPALTPSTTGGSLAASTWYVGVAARGISGYFYGGNSRGSSNSAATTGTTGSITASVASVKGAAAYDWFIGSSTAAFVYAGTTTTSSITITQSTAAAVGGINLPDIASWTPTWNGTADNGSLQLDSNSNPIEFNGLFASITADVTTGSFVTPGTGVANGATYVDGGGSALTLAGQSVAQFDAVFLGIWNKVKTSPTAIMVNAIQAAELTHLLTGTPGASLFLTSDAANRENIVVGGRIGSVINAPAGGVQVPIEVHPSVPPGTVIFRTDTVPFPNSGITSTLKVRTLRDYAEYEYATNRVAGTVGGGPRKEFEIRSVESLVNYAPVAFGVLSNIA